MIFNKDYMYMGANSARTFLPIVQVTGCFTPGTSASTFSKKTLLNNEIVLPTNCISYVFTTSTNSSYYATLTVNGETVTTTTSPLFLTETISSDFVANISGYLNSSSSTAVKASTSFYFSVPKSNGEPDYIIFSATNSYGDSEGDYSSYPYIYSKETKTTTTLKSVNQKLIDPGTYFFYQMRNDSKGLNNSFYIDSTRYYFTGSTASNTTRSEEITITSGTVKASPSATPYSSNANVICLWKK